MKTKPLFLAVQLNKLSYIKTKQVEYVFNVD